MAFNYVNEKDYPRAERLFRDVVARFTETLGPGNLNTGIAQIKLGRSLLRQQRYRDSEIETRAGYHILIKQTSPSTSYLRAARKDLVAEYDALKQPEQSAKFRAELAAAESKPPGSSDKKQ